MVFSFQCTLKSPFTSGISQPHLMEPGYPKFHTQPGTRQRHLQVLLSKARLVLVLRIFGLSAHSLYEAFRCWFGDRCVFGTSQRPISWRKSIQVCSNDTLREIWTDGQKRLKFDVGTLARTHFGLNPHFWLITKKSNIVQSMFRSLNMSE